MNKISFTTASMFLLSAGAIFSTSTQAVEVDCVNHWVNPETQLVQCFDSELNYTAVPFNYFQQINSGAASGVDVVRRRATGLELGNTTEMIMPDLVGSEINAAEDLLLSMGVTLASEEVYEQNKAAREVIQQSPVPGTKLVKGQTVLLEYMGATINPMQMK